nr:M23 family metallopeptidase [Eubacterium sp.]
MWKEKGFYISLIGGIVCIAAVLGIYVSMVSDSKENAAEVPVAEATMPPQETLMPTQAPVSTPVAEEASSGRVKSEVKKTPKPKAKETMKKTNIEDRLHFDQETGLLWPVEGEILIDYSAEKVIFFPTLAQYKTNPALVIASKEGESVKASAAGVVKNIETNEETGTTLTVAIGDDFQVVYGQLKDLTVKKGDEVSEGQVLGKIAKPTKYYTVEGANLYYQVKQKGETVNPLVLLR